MGKFRSKSGCLTCRARRVKCDETHPVCIACSRKNRPCRWEEPHAKFKDYQPEADSSKSSLSGVVEDDYMKMDSGLSKMDQDSGHDSRGRNKNRRANSSEGVSGGMSSSSANPSSGSTFLVPSSTGSKGNSGTGGLPNTQASDEKPDSTANVSEDSIALTHNEAMLVHHFTERLGRWLDCTDTTRQFTLGVPEKVKSCPVLLHAVLCFAARHYKDNSTAESAYQRCIALLIARLNEDAASHDETLLSAIVILRFHEQLNVPSSTGSDDEQHLAGCSAIIRSSQGHHFVDPSAPSMREAAFWVYVRQCLYNATVNQQPPDIDFSLQLHPEPGSMVDSHPLARLRLESAWANQMVWHTACVINFCFDGSVSQGERHKTQRWQELWDKVKTWMKDRPRAFEPIYEGQAGQRGVFPEIWFTTDWHAVSSSFYHFACIMLLSYQPGPKFAMRTAGRLSGKDASPPPHMCTIPPPASNSAQHEILQHARAICGASRSAPETVPLSITVCHTIFIWGPLLSDPRERNEVLQILANFEATHVWPTTWIISALKTEWGMDST